MPVLSPTPPPGLFFHQSILDEVLYLFIAARQVCEGCLMSCNNCERGQTETTQRGCKKKRRDRGRKRRSAPQVNFLLHGSCVYQPPEDQSKPKGVAFLHPPLIQLYLAKSTRQTRELSHSSRDAESFAITDTLVAT